MREDREKRVQSIKAELQRKSKNTIPRTTLFHGVKMTASHHKLSPPVTGNYFGDQQTSPEPPCLPTQYLRLSQGAICARLPQISERNVVQPCCDVRDSAWSLDPEGRGCTRTLNIMEEWRVKTLGGRGRQQVCVCVCVHSIQCDIRIRPIMQMFTANTDFIKVFLDPMFLIYGRIYIRKN